MGKFGADFSPFRDADGGDTTISGANLGFAFMSAVNSAVGSYSTLSLNISDFSRYSKTGPRGIFCQVLIIPFIFTMTAFMGIVIASGGYKVHNLAKIQFDPTRLMKSVGVASLSLLTAER